MRVGCYLTTFEMTSIVKAYYTKSSCRCGHCSEHLSYSEQVVLDTLGPYVYASIQKLQAQGIEVEFVSVGPRTPKLFVPGTKWRVLAIDRFHTIDPSLSTDQWHPQTLI
jgi:hypothetical protein